MNSSSLVPTLLLVALLTVFTFDLSTARPRGRRWPPRKDRKWRGDNEPPLKEPLVVFGDSISDDGVNDVGDVFGFRTWSNGPIWAHYAKGLLNMNLDNYAYGGAKTGKDNYFFEGWSGVLWQIDQYKSRNRRVPSGALIVVVAGANDLFDGKNVTEEMLGNWKTALDQLIKMGARRIIVTTVPALEKMPFYASDSSVGKPLQPLLQQLGAETNAKLKAMVESDEKYKKFVRVFDLFSVMLDGLKEFKVTDEPFSNKRADTKPEDITDYAWFDTIHPSTTMHSYMAKRFRDFLGCPSEG